MWRHVCLGALLAAGLPGCNKILGIDNFQLTPDAPPDAPGPDAQLCWGAGLAPICLTSPAVGVKTLDAALDTDLLGTCTDIIAQPAGPDLCVIAASQINVSNTVTATGSRPLMLVATDSINVGGTLDVSSKRAVAKPGAGANFATCGTGTPAAANTTGPGGGAGGTFQTQGKNGGDGLNSAGAAGGANGIAPGTLGLTFVRGGCKGQDGGDISTTVQGGTGGSSGGAVYLFAANSITVPGNIYASGAGGAAGGLHAGGAGGGSGGLIGLEAPTIDVTGIIAANGGNGSAGSSTVAGGVGADGATMSYNTQPAGATNGTSGGGAGGRGQTGASVGTIGGNGTAVSTGGGGGGGAAGYVWVKGTLTGTMIAPAPTLN